MKKSSKHATKPPAKRAAHAHSPSAAAAVGPAGAAGETVSDDGATAALQQAEGEIGINEWLDPETGEPAEGQSPPHLEED